MQQLELTWDEVTAMLKQLGVELKTLSRYVWDYPLTEAEKSQFFKIRYERGEAIMVKGGFSDYAAVHLQGVVRVYDVEQEEARLPECWDAPRPWQRSRLGRLFGWVLGRSAQEAELANPLGFERFLQFPAEKELPGKPLSIRRPVGGELDLADRFLGVTSVIWNRPRSVTLLADNDAGQPCEMLLIKRKALLEIIFDKKTNAPRVMYQKKMTDFLKQTLPDLLARNHLFRSLIYVEEVRDWSALLAGLSSGRGAARRIVGFLDDSLRQWLGALSPEQLDDFGRYRIVSEINALLKRKDLYAESAWPLRELAAEEQALIRQDTEKLSAHEVYRLNRLLIESAFVGAMRTARDFRPSSPAHFHEFVQQLAANADKALLPMRPEADEVVYEEGDPADALYFVLSGRFRISRQGPGGMIVLNHVAEDDFFGEACVQPVADPRRSAQVEALTKGNLLRVDRDIVLRLAQEYPDFREKLMLERSRFLRRDENRRTGRRLPPSEPPPDIARKLLRATNLLVIDMERCTRCDQCVQACTSAHQDRPRFHRANPDLRFGKWEVAAACVHCIDAPCLEACPVGAITFLEGGNVQIHRNRCIGCKKCVPTCPFDVIDLYPEAFSEEGKSLLKDKGLDKIATKCDLCLTHDRDPPCVVACPYAAAARGSPEEVFTGIRSWAVFTDPETASAPMRPTTLYD